MLAERASISEMTLHKLEKGESGVSIGIVATVLFCLGLLDRFSDLADSTHDQLGRHLEEEHLPKRIRLPRKKSVEDGAL